MVVDAGEVRLDDPHPLAPPRQRQRGPSAESARDDLEGPVGARAGTPIGDDLATGDARHLHRAGRGRAGDQQAVLGDQRHELSERGVHRLFVAEDVGVVELDRGEERDLAGGSAGTSIPCRRTPCRTRRLRRRTRRPRRAARTAGSSAERRRSGTRGRARRPAAPAPATKRWSSCRASRRRPGSAAPPAPRRRGTASRTARGTTRAGSSAPARPGPRRGPCGRRCRRRPRRAPIRGWPGRTPRTPESSAPRAGSTSAGRHVRPSPARRVRPP